MLWTASSSVGKCSPEASHFPAASSLLLGPETTGAWCVSVKTKDHFRSNFKPFMSTAKTACSPHWKASVVIQQGSDRYRFGKPEWRGAFCSVEGQTQSSRSVDCFCDTRVRLVGKSVSPALPRDDATEFLPPFKTLDCTLFHLQDFKLFYILFY